MWRVIPGGDEGQARRLSIPGGDNDEGRLFSPDLGGQCSVSVLEGGGRPRGAIPPADLAGVAGGGQAKPRAGGSGRRWGKGGG